jgi:hypothetical protein
LLIDMATCTWALAMGAGTCSPKKALGHTNLYPSPQWQTEQAPRYLWQVPAGDTCNMQVIACLVRRQLPAYWWAGWNLLTEQVAAYPSREWPLGEQATTCSPSRAVRRPRPDEFRL